MKKLIVLFLLFIGLGAFVYFYEIEGQQERERARELEESLFRLERDNISGVEILRQDEPAVFLRKGDDGDWMLESPVQAAASQTAVDSLLGQITQASRERSLEEKTELETYGLDQPRLKLRVQHDGEEQLLLLGSEDFTGSNLYVKFDGTSQIVLTSTSLADALEKEILDWRSREILRFTRADIAAIEVSRPQEDLKLEKREDQWFLESPLEEPADEGSVNSLLSSLDTAEAEEFVAEDPQDLSEFGLSQPGLTVKVREADQDSWKTLEIGSETEVGYYARNLDQKPVFIVSSEVVDALTKELWEFRNKEVVDIEQDQVTRFVLQRGEEEIVLRHEDLKWIVEEPESHADQEALTYKFWYPITDIEFQSIQDQPEDFPEPEVRVLVTLDDGSTRTYEFARKGERYLARKLETERQGEISEESFQELELQVEDIT